MRAHKTKWISTLMALLLFCVCGSTALAKDAFAVTDPRCEDLVNPLGIDVANPRLSWRMQADYNGAAQSAYQVLCATSPELLREGKADLWDSGKVETDQSRYVVYEGKPIERGMVSYWTVRIWNEKGEASDWSEPAMWTLFDMTSSEDWQAKWITQPYEGLTNPWLRSSFELESIPSEPAFIYVNALGYFQLFINGKRVGSDEFAPHVGQYDKRTFAMTYDVTEYLKEGKNTIGFWLGNGWNIGGAGVNITPSVRAQLELRDGTGATQTVVTDERWRAKPSYMTYTGEWRWGHFGGEVYDARLEEPNWANIDYDDRSWASAVVAEVPTTVVSSPMLPPSLVIETLTAAEVTRIGGGEGTDDAGSAAGGNPALATSSWLVDMGKAMTGRFEIVFPDAPEGHEITMEFGDTVSIEDGEVSINSFRQKSTYIARGSGVERFNNEFNYAGFRYVYIQNVPPGEIDPETIKGYVISTDLEKASTFSTSDETLNEIYAMMEYTLEILMMGGYQVDCHSRERQGYGGDAYASLDTTLCLFRTDAFYRKWTRDWVDQQEPNGNLTYTSPASRHGGGPFWCGFLTAATLKHYHHFADISMVERNYPAIKKWFELAQRKVVDGIQEKFTSQRWYLGDWASPTRIEDSENADIFIQAYMSYALEQAAQLAELLGKTEDAETYRSWIKERRAAAHEKLFDPATASYGSGDQVTYILPLAGGVVPEDLRDEVFAGFERTLLEKDEGHLSTGLSGTYMMIQYLQGIGRDDLIYTFASKRTYPSWGYMIENGATATWEHWEDKNSRIHNCYNSIASWFIQGLAGIRPDIANPGFQNALIKPAFLEQLSYVDASHDTQYGTIHSRWQRNGGGVTMDIGIPANSTATVYVPTASVEGITVNGESVEQAEHVTLLRMEDGKAVLRIASGRYEIVIGTVSVTDLRCEYREAPFGIDVTVPRLSWRLETNTDRRGLRQTAYQIRVASSEELLKENEPDLWDSGRVESDRTSQVDYAGKPLTSRTRCYWQVRVWDQNNQPTEWSEPSMWTMGLLEHDDWQAEWIGYDAAYELTPEQKNDDALFSLRGLPWVEIPADHGVESTPTGFRYQLQLPDDRKVRRAVLAFYAFHSAEAWVNDTRVGAAYHWEKTTRVDITDELRTGDNVIALLGDQTDPHRPAIIGRIVVQFDSGEDMNLPINESWKTSQTLPENWYQADFDDSGWVQAAELDNPWGSTPPVADVERVPAPYLRHAFDVDNPIRRATVYVTALGTYELRLNGERVGNDMLAPGWTDFRKRVHYQTYDVTGQVKEGSNAIAAILGDGWYASNLAHLGRRNLYGGRPRLLVQLEIEREDGEIQIVTTNKNWKASYGPIRHADIQIGCEYDARLEMPGWDRAGFDASGWAAVLTGPIEDSPILQASVAEPSRVIDELPAVRLTEPRPGRWTFDLGQNMVGWVRIKVRGEPGQRITVRHAEMLNADGTVYTAALRSCPATDYFILAGDGEETLEPYFTFHGFQFVEITGLTSPPEVEDVTGIVVHTPMRRTGHFESSHERLNQLYSNIIWGQKGNFLEVPTDCPQRDERMGWTGDTQFFAPTALYNFDGANFYARWLQNCEDDQFDDGRFPHVVPRIWGGGGATGWGDAAVICTYLVYQAYNDTRIIEQRYDSLERYMNWLETKVDEQGITQVGGFGDWLNAGSTAPKPLMDTAYHAYLADIMSQMAAAIGREADAKRYAERKSQVRGNFVSRFLNPNGALLDSGQTGYALAFTMDLLPDGMSEPAAGHFVESVRSEDWHLGTGFIGTPRLLPGLARAGRDDVAYRLLLTETYPSWLFPVKNGATTMWERWDGWTPENGFGPVNMNSFNHYAFGAVGEYLYSGIGGIQSTSPGYRSIRIRPAIPGPEWMEIPATLDWANTSFLSPSGTITSNWRLDGDALTLEVEIPPNTTAEVHVPTSDVTSLTENGLPVDEAAGLRFLRMESGAAVFETVSGRYTFSGTR